jgi:uncharacterized damage-inducible protein DinB
MREVFEALAKYKQKVDENVIGIAEKLDSGKLVAPMGTYFPSVFDQLKHLFSSDVNWIKRLKPAFPKSEALGRSRFADFDNDSLKTLDAKDAKVLFANMKELDATVRAFVSELDESALVKNVEYKNYKGQSENHPLWQVLLQWFNHGTHHRGTISGQLDILGVDNDYSSLIAKI